MQMTNGRLKGKMLTKLGLNNVALHPRLVLAKRGVLFHNPFSI